MIAISPALALIDTVRKGRGNGEGDPIASPAMLEKWLIEAALLPRGAIPLNISHVRQVRELRVATFNCVSAVLAGTLLPAADVALINRLAAMPAFRPQLVNGTLVKEAKNPRNAALSLLAADAIEILALRRERFRSCPGCARIFIDDSMRRDLQRCC